MRAENKIQIIFLISCLVFSTSVFCGENLDLKLIWQSPMLEGNPICFFNPQQKTTRYFTDGKISIVNEKGEMIYENSLETIIGRDRKDSIYFFEKGETYPEIDELHGLKVDLARFTHFSRSLNFFAQFTLYKNGELQLEMFRWDSQKNDYTLHWRNEVASTFIEMFRFSIRQTNKFPQVYVSTMGWLAIKMDFGDYCNDPNNHQDTVWVYDAKGVLIANFAAGDEYFYACEVHDSVTRIPGGIIESVRFSNDGAKLLVQGRSKQNVDDQVFLVFDDKGDIIWNILIPCEDLSLGQHFCGSKYGSQFPIYDEWHDFKTIIYCGNVFRIEPPELKAKTIDFLDPKAFNKDETKIIYESRDRKKLVIYNLIDGSSKELFKSSSDSLANVCWSEKEDRIYLATEVNTRTPTIGEIRFTKEAKSRFRIIDSKCNVIYSVTIAGYASETTISSDERLLFVDLGNQLKIYSISIDEG